MKYLVIINLVEKDMAKVAKVSQEYTEAQKKDPDKYPNVLFDPHIMCKGLKGFAVWEGDEDQMARKLAFCLPEIEYTLIPIIDYEKFLMAYMEVKK